MTDFSRTKPTVKRGDLAQHCSPLCPLLTPRESEGCISALLHKSVSHIFEYTQPNVLIHVRYGQATSAERQAKNSLHETLIIFLLSSYICSTTKSFSLSLFKQCQLCTRKVLPIQGFPFRINKTTSTTYPVITQQTRASVDMQGRLSYTQAHARNECTKEQSARGGLYNPDFFFFQCQFAVTAFFSPSTMAWEHQEVKVS